MNRDSILQNINVFTRYRTRRPVNDVERFIADEAGDEKTEKMIIDEKSNIVYIGNNRRQFPFKRVFGPETTQQQIFDVVGKATCDDILSGYNGTIFVYGQTGSGKTYTLYGAEDKPKEEPPSYSSLYPVLRAPAPDIAPDIAPDVIPKNKPNKIQTMGLIPRSAHYLFNQLHNTEGIDTFNVTCSFMEIYQEQPRDLLNKSNKQNLKIKVNHKGEEYIQGLQQSTVYELRGVLQLIQTALKNRCMDNLNMNMVSPRAHLLMQMKVTIHSKDGTVRTAIANFVDLAGSEQVKPVNKSLSSLGLVINQLSSGKKGNIAYTDSILTHVLANSLGGNCKTSLIVTASPHEYNREETISSLRFGINCKMVQNKAKINKTYSNEELMKKVTFLQEKNDELQDIIKNKGYGADADEESLEQIHSLKEEVWDLTNKLNVEMKKRLFYGQQIEELKVNEELKAMETENEENKNKIKDLNETLIVQREKEETLAEKLKWIEQRNEECNNKIHTLESELDTLRPIKSDLERLQSSNTHNIQKQQDLSHLLQQMEQEKIKYEQDRLSLEHIASDKENEYKMKENKLKSQNERLLTEQKKLKQELNDKEKERVIILQQQKELLEKEEELEREYEAKLEVLQTAYSNEQKGLEDSMAKIARNKQEMEQSMSAKEKQKEEILREQLMIEIGKEMEKTFEKERNEMYENQFEHQEKLQSELNKAQQHIDRLKHTTNAQMNEITVLKIKQTQKLEMIESVNQSLLSQNETLKKQINRQKERNNKKLQEQIETERAQNQFQFEMMKKQYEKELESLKDELEIETAKNVSMQSHIDEKEDVLTNKRKDEAEVIEQQLAYLDSLNLVIQLNEEQKQSERDHKKAMELHKRLNSKNNNIFDAEFDAEFVAGVLQSGVSITDLFPKKSVVYNDDDEKGQELQGLDGSNHECCICLEEYEEREEKRLLPCMHIFHANCVNQWIVGMDNRYCPICGVNADQPIM